MTEKLQRITCYHKSDLADFYEINLRIFMQWIKNIDDKLRNTGYKKNQKVFTQKQVEIIFEHLGHPPTNSNDFHKDIRVALIPYELRKLAQLYNISGGTLMRQINSIPVANDFKIIMNRDKHPSWRLMQHKSFFNKNAVSLIFKHLGHPYKKTQ